MADDLTYLARADQHIADVKERIVRQRQHIARLVAKGHNVRGEESFLSALVNVQSAFEHHRLLILSRL
jgi:hypothetical protein